ncbi:MAG: hypothetical protein PUI80_04800 [Peptoniphilaceae bacterium]|nr:hypothetical protein [Peptoniphilaceae bacterium]
MNLENRNYKNSVVTDQLYKCLKLYDESEKRGFISSSNFMEQFIGRQFDKKGKRKFTISEITKLLSCEPKYSDSRNNRIILSNGKNHIVIENNRIVTLRLGRLVQQWKEI